MKEVKGLITSKKDWYHSNVVIIVTLHKLLLPIQVANFFLWCLLAKKMRKFMFFKKYNLEPLKEISPVALAQ